LLVIGLLVLNEWYSFQDLSGNDLPSC
jgi:hypothetical protein